MKTLGERMKENYEEPFDFRLPMRMPVVVRVDGKSFHTWTRSAGLDLFDESFHAAMTRVAEGLVGELQGAEMVYQQSDEASVVLHNYKRFNSQAMFNNRVQKLASVAASVATAYFNGSRPGGVPALFDARAFVLPVDELNNYLVWRQRDCRRNSINKLGQAHFSRGELRGRGAPEVLQMLSGAGHAWEDELPEKFRAGTLLVGGGEPVAAPDFRCDQWIAWLGEIMSREE